MLPAIKNSLPTQNAIMMIMILSQLSQGLNRDHKMDLFARNKTIFIYCFDTFLYHFFGKKLILLPLINFR